MNGRQNTEVFKPVKNGKKIRVFKSFEEQELYFLEYFFTLTPSQRLQELARVQKKNLLDPNAIISKKITIRKPITNGH